MSHRQRFVIEGTWSGYTSAQRRVCHRTVETNFIDRYKAISAIQFTDGTTMSIHVRPCLPREKVEERHGYDTLLDKIVHKGLSGFVSVRDVEL